MMTSLQAQLLLAEEKIKELQQTVRILRQWIEDLEGQRKTSSLSPSASHFPISSTRKKGA